MTKLAIISDGSKPLKNNMHERYVLGHTSGLAKRHDPRQRLSAELCVTLVHIVLEPSEIINVEVDYSKLVG